MKLHHKKTISVSTNEDLTNFLYPNSLLLASLGNVNFDIGLQKFKMSGGGGNNGNSNIEETTLNAEPPKNSANFNIFQQPFQNFWFWIVFFGELNV